MLENKQDHSVAAVVVTYNRLELLKQCVQSLRKQTVACDILIVDNASTDGTAQWLEMQTDISFCNTGSNLGGAGGFNYGMRWAVEVGYDYVWVMDDDTLPEIDALEKLLDADAALKGEYGWLSSVALWTDGRECRMNRPKIKKAFYAHIELLQYGIIQAEQATFVSLFLPAEKIRRFGLPIKEFFLWGDDIEYTRRIAVRGDCPGYVVGQSQVIHAMKSNSGSNLAMDDAERIARYKLAFRNEAYTYRREGAKGVCYYIAKRGRDFLWLLTRAKDHRLKRLRTLFCGMLEGICFAPEVEFVKCSETEPKTAAMR